MEKLNLKVFEILNSKALETLEEEYRNKEAADYIPFANQTSFKEIAEKVIPDRVGAWQNPLQYTISYHKSIIGMGNLSQMVFSFLQNYDSGMAIDILSITSEMIEGRIMLKCLFRVYTKDFLFANFFKITGDSLTNEEKERENITVSGQLVIPDEIKNFSYSETEIQQHKELYESQQTIYEECTKERPFLNSINKYIPKELKDPADHAELIYDLMTIDKQVQTVSSYESFTEVFREMMTFVNGVEYYSYINVIKGEKDIESFMQYIGTYLMDTYVNKGRLPQEDYSIMINKLERSLFKLYIIQDLIDDPQVTDIKITSPKSIRVRINGKAYLSNVTFIDEADYRRFVNMICIRNRIQQNIPEQTFTDDKDENYILRFSLTSQYVNSVNWPYMHIRKVDRNKLLADDLIKAGMMDEKIRDYLLDCGKHSRGVVFAGPPGSGKTICLNWFLEEAYEDSAEILVIQENDELFSDRNGVMFQHVVNYPNENEYPVSLEELGQLALVAGANVFIIGETKGAEICSAITLSNSGCRTAMTIHSPSSTETIDKMADLAMRGFAVNVEQAKKSLRSFQTIVYLENFKIKEISEIIGYNEQKHDMEYRYIYRRDA